MESLVLQIADMSAFLIDLFWLPLLIWTMISSLAWLVLRTFDHLHPVYQYHTRLALIFSLPAGLFFVALVNKISAWMATTADEPVFMFITMTSPIDIAFTTAGESTGIPFVSVIQVSVFFLILAGALYFLSRFVYQSLQLVKFRKEYSFRPITQIDHINPENLGLALATRKCVRVSFLQTDIVPVTFGFRKPVILLPKSLRDDPQKLNLTLRHELTHITQHDFFSHLMVIVTEAFFWFHPLVHQLKRELVEYREMRCDHLVLSENSVSRKEYASLLLELIPMPNIDKKLSVNMAQESSNLKKRITMITQHTNRKPIPKRASLALLAAIFLSTAIVMACTDMQTQNVFDEEELDLMTDVDRTGERGYHQVIIYMSEEEQAERHESKLAQLEQLQPEHIQSVEVIKGEEAVERYGSRGEKGVIVVNTKLSEESYNITLKALGMEPQVIPPPPPAEVESGDLQPNDPSAPPPPPPSDQDDFFVVVEKMPELIGGLAELQSKIRYPELARRAGIEGRVYVQFIVNEQGQVEDPQVIRGIGGGADEEALRVVRQAEFKPGMQRGRPVRIQYSLPISFRLESNNEQVDGGETSAGYSAEIGEPENSASQMSVQLNRDGEQITGRVLDEVTREPLVGANIILEGSNRGAATDMEGRFSITNVDSESTHLTISFVGYTTSRINIYSL